MYILEKMQGESNETMYILEKKHGEDNDMMYILEKCMEKFNDYLYILSFLRLPDDPVFLGGAVDGLGHVSVA